MMTSMTRTVLLLVAACMLTAANAQVPAGRQGELDEVVVTGRFPGPPLWKVSRGDHALWILPLVDMYPKKMQWDSTRVERLFTASQEYIARPRASNGFYATNPLLIFSGMGLYSKAVYLPGKQTLSDVLPPDIYKRYRALKSRYFPRNASIERRTLGAATQLMQEAILDHENLEMLRYNNAYSPELITDRTSKWQKASKTMRLTSVATGKTVKVGSGELKALKKVIDDASKSPAFQKQQLACFEQVLAYFEKDLEPVKRRANAWARGRADDLVNPTPLYSVASSCLDPMFNIRDLPAMQKVQRDFPALAEVVADDGVAAKQASKQKWLDAAEAALERNTSTFAVLAVNDVLDQDGLVEQLRAKGYTVEISAQ